MAAELRIERLVIRVPGVRPGDAERLAAGVGDALTRRAPGLRAGTRTARLEVRLAAQPGASVEALAEQVAAAVVERLR